MTEKPKPCPFCGVVPEIDENDFVWHNQEKGYRCAFGDHGVHVDNWNRRTSGWISVDDRMPDASGWYVVAYQYDGEPSVGARHYCIIDRVFAGRAVITHWMPNPVSPEVEK